MEFFLLCAACGADAVSLELGEDVDDRAYILWYRWTDAVLDSLGHPVGSDGWVEYYSGR